MHFTLLSLGKWKSGPEKSLFEHYAGRLPGGIALKEMEVKKPLTGDALKEKEAELILAALRPGEVLWALDEKGKEFSSPVLAGHIEKLRDEGVRSLAFAIGGAAGLHESVRHKAHLVLSFGRVTWPHLLVRGLLAEQIYRAHTILTGHPYHRE